MLRRLLQLHRYGLSKFKELQKTVKQHKKNKHSKRKFSSHSVFLAKEYFALMDVNFTWQDLGVTDIEWHLYVSTNV